MTETYKQKMQGELDWAHAMADRAESDIGLCESEPTTAEAQVLALCSIARTLIVIAHSLNWFDDLQHERQELRSV
jgi:hypothetical protein